MKKKKKRNSPKNGDRHEPSGGGRGYKHDGTQGQQGGGGRKRTLNPQLSRKRTLVLKNGDRLRLYVPK